MSRLFGSTQHAFRLPPAVATSAAAALAGHRARLCGPDRLLTSSPPASCSKRGCACTAAASRRLQAASTSALATACSRSQAAVRSYDSGNRICTPGSAASRVCVQVDRGLEEQRANRTCPAAPTSGAHTRCWYGPARCRHTATAQRACTACTSCSAQAQHAQQGTHLEAAVLQL